MKTLYATTQLGNLNQQFSIQNSNKLFPYSGPQQHKDGAIDTFFLLVPAHDFTTDVELIAVTKTLLANVYAIGSNSGLNISMVLQYRFHQRGILINIWSDNAQE